MFNFYKEFNRLTDYFNVLLRGSEIDVGFICNVTASLVMVLIMVIYPFLFGSLDGGEIEIVWRISR